MVVVNSITPAATATNKPRPRSYFTPRTLAGILPYMQQYTVKLYRTLYNPTAGVRPPLRREYISQIKEMRLWPIKERPRSSTTSHGTQIKTPKLAKQPRTSHSHHQLSTPTSAHTKGSKQPSNNSDMTPLQLCLHLVMRPSQPTKSVQERFQVLATNSQTPLTRNATIAELFSTLLQIFSTAHPLACTIDRYTPHLDNNIGCGANQSTDM